MQKLILIFSLAFVVISKSFPGLLRQDIATTANTRIHVKFTSWDLVPKKSTMESASYSSNLQLASGNKLYAFKNIDGLWGLVAFYPFHHNIDVSEYSHDSRYTQVPFFNAFHFCIQTPHYSKTIEISIGALVKAFGAFGSPSSLMPDAVQFNHSENAPCCENQCSQNKYSKPKLFPSDIFQNQHASTRSANLTISFFQFRNSLPQNGTSPSTRTRRPYSLFASRRNRTRTPEPRVQRLWLRLWQTSMRALSRRAGSAIDGKLPGDVGFDPFGIARTPERLIRLREIELKHARIAMLASIGWPVSELFHAPLRSLLESAGLSIPTSPLDDTNRALTVLNGGLLTGPNSATLGVFMLAFSATEYWLFTNRKSLSSKRLGPQPGDFGFDPFNLLESRGGSPQARHSMKEDELVNGRVAMVAIVVFALSELITGKAIVDNTPFLFRPIWDILRW